MHLRLRLILICSCSAVLFTACVPMAFLGAGALTGGYIAGRDKKVSQSLGDAKIDAQIKNRLQEYTAKTFTGVSVVTDNGCVLLTGHVPDESLIQDVEKIAWSIPGVKIVDNNITVGQTSFGQTMKDAYITSACRTALIGTENIKSLNIKIKTMSNIVYLSGVVQSNEELNIVIDTIKQIQGVKKVVSYISVKNGK